MRLKFYHGTSSINAEKLMNKGAEKLYLTLDDEQAQYYAEVAAEEDGSAPTVLVVEVEDFMLYADLPSFSEPLSYILKYNNMNESDWNSSLSSGLIKYPSHDDWKTSIKYTKTLLAKGNIDKRNIYFGDLYSEDIDKVNDLASQKEVNKKKNKI